MEVTDTAKLYDYYSVFACLWIMEPVNKPWRSVIKEYSHEVSLTKEVAAISPKKCFNKLLNMLHVNYAICDVITLF